MTKSKSAPRIVEQINLSDYTSSYNTRSVLTQFTNIFIEANVDINIVVVLDYNNNHILVRPNNDKILLFTGPTRPAVYADLMLNENTVIMLCQIGFECFYAESIKRLQTVSINC